VLHAAPVGPRISAPAQNGGVSASRVNSTGGLAAAMVTPPSLSACCTCGSLAAAASGPMDARLVVDPSATPTSIPLESGRCVTVTTCSAVDTNASLVTRFALASSSVFEYRAGMTFTVIRLAPRSRTTESTVAGVRPFQRMTERAELFEGSASRTGGTPSAALSEWPTS